MLLISGNYIKGEKMSFLSAANKHIEIIDATTKAVERLLLFGRYSEVRITISDRPDKFGGVITAESIPTSYCADITELGGAIPSISCINSKIINVVESYTINIMLPADFKDKNLDYIKKITLFQREIINKDLDSYVIIVPVGKAKKQYNTEDSRENIEKMLDSSFGNIDTCFIVPHNDAFVSGFDNAIMTIRKQKTKQQVK